MKVAPKIYDMINSAGESRKHTGEKVRGEPLDMIYKSYNTKRTIMKNWEPKTVPKELDLKKVGPQENGGMNLRFPFFK